MSRQRKTLTRSFAGGEMSPEMFGRMDDIQFQAGAETLLNMIPRPTGSAARRSGTSLVREIRDSSKSAHLFPFVFGQSDSFVVEAGRADIGAEELDSGYFRFHTGGRTLLSGAAKESWRKPTSLAVANMTQVACDVTGSGGLITLTGHGLEAGNLVQFYAGLYPACVGHTDRNGNTIATNGRPITGVWYHIRDITANTFKIAAGNNPANAAVAFLSDGFEVAMRSYVSGGNATVPTTPPGWLPAATTSGNKLWSYPGQDRWWGVRDYSSYSGGHELKAGDKVFVTMAPWSTSNVAFSGSYFRFGGGYTGTGGLSRHAPQLGQQVLFQGDDLPSGIDAGRPYYIIHNTGTIDGLPKWRISATRGGVPHPSKGVAYAVLADAGVAAMPIALDKVGGTAYGRWSAGVTAGGSTSTSLHPSPDPGDPGHFDALKTYYVVKDSPAIHTRLRLAESYAESQDPDGGIVMGGASGAGARYIHKANEAGDVVWHGGKAHYCCRDSISGGGGRVTTELHGQSGPRIPDQRDSLAEAEYWREIPGKSTGCAFPVEMTIESPGYLLVSRTGNGGDHGLSNGQAVSLFRGSVGGVINSSVHYVIEKTATTFRLEAVLGSGTPVPVGTSYIDSVGTMMHAWPTWNIATDKVGWPSHGLADGDPVVFSEPEGLFGGGSLTPTLPPELTHGTVYYVANKTTDEFQVSATKYGEVIDLTGSPNNFHVVSGANYYEVPHNYTEAELPEISTTQSNDILTLASTLQPARELRRLSSAKWDLKEIAFKAAVSAPSALRELEIEPGEVFRIFGAQSLSMEDQGSSAPMPMKLRTAPFIYVPYASPYTDSVGVGLVFVNTYGGSISAAELEESTNLPPYEKGDTIYVSGMEAGMVDMQYGWGVPLMWEGTHPLFSLEDGYYRVYGVDDDVAGANNRVHICNLDGTGIRKDQITAPEGILADREGHSIGSNNTSPNYAIYKYGAIAYGGVYTWNQPTTFPSGTQGSWLVDEKSHCRVATPGDETEQEYVVTAVDANNEESAGSEPLAAKNNLYVSGSFNRITWSASRGATRYRIYKKISGLYGFIGETDEVEFKDDNIGPDLAVAPPINDGSMRKSISKGDHRLYDLGSDQLFFTGGDYVKWPGHGFASGAPVVFSTTDELPGLEEGRTYYVTNEDEDTFQVAADPDNLSAVVGMSGGLTGVHTAIGGLFPGATTYYEGRRVFGGSKERPQDVFMSASGSEADMSYSIPTVDSDRIYFRIAAREQSRVRHILPLAQLLMLSDSTEFQVTPANDDILTPSSISVRPQSFIGAGIAAPALVNNTTVFAAARGGHVRELGYSSAVLGYLTGDLSIRASHLFDGFTIKDMTYSKAPLPIVWCVSTSGKLLGVTYVPEEKVAAWHQHTTTNGTFESVVSVPEGDEDAVYVIVKRGAKRYVERFADTYRGGTASIADAFFVDNGVTYSGTATTTINGLAHLNGESVAYLADGLPGTGTVSGGTLTLTKAAAKVHVGLPMTSQIKTLPMTMLNVDAFGTGKTKNITRVWARLFESAAFEAGPDASSVRSSLSPAAGALLSDLVEVTMPSSWNDSGQIIIQQGNPLPFTVAGLTIEVASGG